MQLRLQAARGLGARRISDQTVRNRLHSDGWVEIANRCSKASAYAMSHAITLRVGSRTESLD